MKLIDKSKKLISTLLPCLLLTPLVAKADIWESIFDAISGMDTHTQNGLHTLDTDMNSMNKSLTDKIDNETKQLIGNYGYGNLNYDPKLMSWGEGTSQWSSIMNLYQSSSAGLGQAMSKMVTDFPVISNQNNAFNPYTPQEIKQYELLQSQTTLAARASSQVAFDKIDQESKVLSTLNQKIDSVQNAKGATDLNNRLSAENGNIQLQIEKLLAVLVQQNAVEAQGEQQEAKAAKDFYNYTGK